VRAEPFTRSNSNATRSGTSRALSGAGPVLQTRADVSRRTYRAPECGGFGSKRATQASRDTKMTNLALRRVWTSPFEDLPAHAESGACPISASTNQALTCLIRGSAILRPAGPPNKSEVPANPAPAEERGRSVRRCAPAG
jgi:hypothetical protein